MKIRILNYLCIVILLLTSCKKNLDINTDPNNPSTIEVSKLLPTTEVALGNALCIGGVSNVLEVYTHQLTSREEQDQYGAKGSNYYIDLCWQTLYETNLNNLEALIDEATTAGDLQYAGIAKVLKAYTFSQLVDMFGDIPFSEANKFRGGITYAKFDDDATIYPQLFALLNEGITDMQNADALNLHTPSADDIIYNGNIDNWIKAANSIKLKLYIQESKIMDVSAEVNSLINSANLISATDESFLLPYGPNGATDDRNPGFGDYTASQRGNYISPWFHELLSGYRTNLFTGIVDPRIPYYYYNQLDANTEAGHPDEYRDGPFLSIYFGSLGPNAAQIQQTAMTVLGIYPVGGRYDEGDALGATTSTGVDGSSGTGAAPYRFITYADILYLKAEAIHKGIITGDERAVLQAAINESFNQVDYVITQFVKPQQTVPALVGTSAVTDYVSAVMAEYDAGTDDKQLEIIMTEKWISSFGSAVDQYTDYRRTGYPILFNPNDATMAPGGIVQPPIHGDPEEDPQPEVLVQLTRSYPLSLPWDQTEIESNPNAPDQKNPSDYKVFWQP